MEEDGTTALLGWTGTGFSEVGVDLGGNVGEWWGAAVVVVDDGLWEGLGSCGRRRLGRGLSARS